LKVFASIVPPELPGKYQQTHLVAEAGETLQEMVENFVYKYLSSYL
jgi:hypothetical protein